MVSLNDARLVLDTLRSASRHGAAVMNYTRFIQAQRGDLWTCEVETVADGARHTLQAKAVVNATGPWADGLPHSAVKLRLTKGIHLVVDRPRLPVTDALVMTEGSRVLFAIPWGDRTILGTTDTDYDGPLDAVTADANDVAYVLRIANQFFPTRKLSCADVISTWAGLRPLIADPKGKPSDISRSHEIKSPEPNWWDVAGGKLTTCRLMAEQTFDRVIRGAELQAQPCETAEELLLTEPDAFSGITPPAVSREAVSHYCKHEWAQHLDDVMIRRTSWHYYHADAEVIARQVLEWMAELRAWDEEKKAAEWTAYQRLLSLSTRGSTQIIANEALLAGVDLIALVLTNIQQPFADDRQRPSVWRNPELVRLSSLQPSGDNSSQCRLPVSPRHKILPSTCSRLARRMLIL